MTDFSKPDTDLPPPLEDSIPDMSQLNIQNIVKEEQALAPEPGNSSENQVSLADLNQIYINNIAKFLDPKSLLRLQLTCKSLFQKGAAAQHLVTFTPYAILYRIVVFPPMAPKMTFFPYKINETLFKATGFCLKAVTFQITGDFTPQVFDYIEECLSGRGTIGHLDMGEYTATVDAIASYHVSELSVWTLPVNYFDQPYVQKLDKLNHFGNFPVSLTYMCDSATHSGRISFARGQFDLDDVTQLLKKWAANEKVIKELSLHLFEFRGWDHLKTFAGWKIVSSNEDLPSERPVIRRQRFGRFLLIRTDGNTLYITHHNGDFTLSINGYAEDSPLFSDSDSDDYDSFYGGYRHAWYDSDDDGWHSP